MQSISLIRPDDWHVHLRDQAVLQHTVAATAKHFGRALIMPNLQPALTTVSAVLEYRSRILSHIPATSTFHPYMTLYLNTSVNETELSLAAQCPDILGAKLYPAGATTHSEEGVGQITDLYPLFEIMQSYDLVLQVHGEVTYGDIFEREALFIETQLQPLIKNFPKLRIVVEHISSKAAVDFVVQAPPQVVATVTPQHLMYHRNHLLAGGIKPHYYCLPILKHQQDQIAIQQVVRSGHPKFFAGTDSAPHPRSQKESACGCAGVFSAPYAVALYAQIFETLDAIPKLNHFLSRFGAEFYHLPQHAETITLIKKTQSIAPSWPLGTDEVIPLAAGTQLNWSIYEQE
ncbi:MAG: dihydroorotase [Legionella sp.]|nr:MAG: dihydroorotase [Legionella sp.]